MKKKWLYISIILILSISLILPLVSCKKEEEPTEPVIPYEYVEGSTILISMGLYPQTVSDIDVATIKSGTYDETSGYYTYDGNQYAICEAYPFDIEYTPTFSNNQSVVVGKEYAFKVEPIIWKILNKNLGDDFYLIYANRVLDTCVYQLQENFKKGTDSFSNYYLLDNDGNLCIEQEYYANNYEYSALRYTLKQFYNKAFNEGNKSAIQTVEVNNKNSGHSGPEYNPDHQNNTQDKVFVLSKAEATNSKYGFTQEDLYKRYREASDYAIARGVYYQQRQEVARVAWTWTRTSTTNSNGIYKINTEGNITEQFISSDSDYKVGYAPAMKVNKR